jgi:hypothetical protein
LPFDILTDVGKNAIKFKYKILLESISKLLQKWYFYALVKLLERGNTTQAGHYFLPKAVAELEILCWNGAKAHIPYLVRPLFVDVNITDEFGYNELGLCDPRL